MKIRPIFAVLTILFLLVAFPITVYAQEKVERNRFIVLPKDTVVNDDYFGAGDTVTLSGTVNGDAYVAGGNVLIDGTVNGDVIAAGGAVTISGTVTNDVRVAGGQVTISGDVGKNVTAGGGSVAVTSDANIMGSLVSGSGQLSVLGPVGRSITAGAGQMTIASAIGGNVKAGTGQLTLAPNARVNGDLSYWSEDTAHLQDGAVVLGRTIKHDPPADKPSPEKVAGFISGVNVTFKLISVISALILGLLFIKFLPNFMDRYAETITTKPLQSVGLGFVTTILLPIAFVFLFVTIIGIPIALLLVVLFFILAYFAKIFVALAVGKYLLGYVNRKGNALALTVGLVLYFFLTLLPVFGWLITILTVFFGIGGGLLVKKQYFKELRKSKLI